MDISLFLSTMGSCFIKHFTKTVLVPLMEPKNKNSTTKVEFYQMGPEKPTCAFLQAWFGASHLALEQAL
jgi:hypothetical protein